MRKLMSLKNVKRIFSLILLSLFIFVSFSSLKVNALTSTGGASYDVTESLANKGIGYGVQFKQDKGMTNGSQQQVVSVLEVPSEQGIMVIPYTNLSNSEWNFTTVKSSIALYEQQNPGYKVVAAINGGAFDINKDLNFYKQCTGPFCYQGNYYKTTINKSGMWSGSYGFKNDGTGGKQLVSNSIDGQFQKTDYMVLAIFDKEDNIIKELKIENWNAEPADNESSVYFGLWNDVHKYVDFELPTVSGASSILVDGELTLPNNENDFYGLGTVSNESFSGTVTAKKFAIVSKNQEVIDALKVGTKVRVQFEAVGAFEGVEYVFGGGQIVLQNGEATSNVNEAASDTHPRTAIGVKEDGSYVFVVVDGRNEKIGRVGVGGARLSAVMKNYGCVEAYNLDGGGSSTVVIRNGNDFEIMNVPSDGNPRSDGDCLLVVVKEPTINFEVTEATDKTLTVKADIIDEGNFDIDHITVTAEASKADVVDGYATLKSLRQKTEYEMSYMIVTKSGKTFTTYFTQKVHTDVQEHKIKSLTYEETNESFDFVLEYSDRGKVTNLGSAILVVNGKEFELVDGEVSVPKREVGEYILGTEIKYQCDSYDGIVDKIAFNCHTYVIATIEMIESSYNEYFKSFFGSVNGGNE